MTGRQIIQAEDGLSTVIVDIQRGRVWIGPSEDDLFIGMDADTAEAAGRALLDRAKLLRESREP